MKLLLVDDDPEIRSSVRLGFELQWRDVEIVEADRGADALARVEQERPDLVLLDIGLPDMDGYRVLREIRAFSSVPVIMLTARDEPIDKVRGLEAGADDYVAKPFDHLELMARVRAVLRRLDLKAPPERVAPYRRDGLAIDVAARGAGKVLWFFEQRFYGEALLVQPARRSRRSIAITGASAPV